MRGVLIDWLIEVHSQFKLLQETLYMTIFIIDKFLQVILCENVWIVSTNLFIHRLKASLSGETSFSWSE